MATVVNMVTHIFRICVSESTLVDIEEIAKSIHAVSGKGIQLICV
jgi:hypothetical protein